MVEQLTHEGFPPRVICRVGELSESGYYQWKSRASKRAAREESDRQLFDIMKELYEKSRKSFGERSLTSAMNRRGVKINRKKVARLKAKYGIYSKKKKRFRTTTVADGSQQASKNILNRDFSATAPLQRQVSDITYLPLKGGNYCYLATVIDLFSRRVVGYQLSDRLDTDSLLRGAFIDFVEQRRIVRGTLFHSDRGCQYTSKEFRKLIDLYGIQQSMSRKGNCWDNAVAESFFATLKWELMDNSTRDFQSLEETQVEVGRYIEFYNNERPHSFCKGSSPVDFEREQVINNLSTGYESPSPFGNPHPPGGNLENCGKLQQTVVALLTTTTSDI